MEKDNNYRENQSYDSGLRRINYDQKIFETSTTVNT